VRVVYLHEIEEICEADERDVRRPPDPFRTSEAGLVWLDPRGELDTDTRVQLGANSTHALMGHGVVDALNRIPLEGRLGIGRDVMVPQARLGAVASVLYEADRRTYGRTWEFVVPAASETADVEYRVRVDNRSYQRDLLRLVDLVTLASRRGHAVRLRV
jgi:hypothetical protein